jgi:hypothetical protein
MTDENVVGEVLVENDDAAIYAMENTTSSNGAISGAKQHFAEKHDVEYGDVDATLFTKGYGPAEQVAAVKHE